VGVGGGGGVVFEIKVMISFETCNKALPKVENICIILQRSLVKTGCVPFL
jgi:hypothetical protein